MIPSLAKWVKESIVAMAAVYIAAVVQIQSLALEFPYAEGVAINKMVHNDQHFSFQTLTAPKTW